VIERLNREIRRRTRVISIFPSRDSYLRLVTTYLMEYTEDWIKERSYIKKEKLLNIMDCFYKTNSKEKEKVA